MHPLRPGKATTIVPISWHPPIVSFMLSNHIAGVGCLPECGDWAILPSVLRRNQLANIKYGDSKRCKTWVTRR